MRTINCGYTKFGFTVDEGKGTAESFSRQKLRQAPQKEGGQIMCGPVWCVHKSDVQNKWNDNTHKIDRAGLRGNVHFNKYTHTHTDQRFS